MAKIEWEEEKSASERASIEPPPFKVPTDKSRSLYEEARNYSPAGVQGAAIVRCNVNFGDPHIEAYCSLLRNRQLVTDHDDPAIPCGHDGAGWTAPIVGS